jgi:hypothetical protein
MYENVICDWVVINQSMMVTVKLGSVDFNLIVREERETSANPTSIREERET